MPNTCRTVHVRLDIQCYVDELLDSGCWHVCYMALRCCTLFAPSGTRSDEQLLQLLCYNSG